MALHGVVIREEALGAPPIGESDVSTIGIIGTAPDAKVYGPFGDRTKILYNTPFLVTKRTDAAGLGKTGTLPQALDSIYAQGNVKVAMVIIDHIDHDETTYQDFEVTTFTTHGSDAWNDNNNPNEALWTVQTDSENVYLAFKNPTAADVTLLEGLRDGDQVQVKDAGDTVVKTFHVAGSYESDSESNSGRLPIVTGSDTGLTTGNNYTVQEVIFTIADKDKIRVRATGEAADLTGVYALLGAKSILGTKPRILCAPGVDTGSRPDGAANGLAEVMYTVAGRLRGIAVIDGPSTNHEEAIGYIEAFDSDRAYVVDPAAKIDTENGVVEQAMSGFVAGLIAVNDFKRGWWTSPSNRPLRGLIGTARPIDYEPGDPSSRAQLMNDNAITTVINQNGGFKLWGNETPAKSDPAYKFLNVRRTADVLADSIQQNHFSAVDKNITKNYLSEVENGVNAFIRTLIAKEALIGGRCYADGELNTPDNIAKGEVYFNVEFTPTYPAQTITFNVQLTTKYLSELAA